MALGEGILWATVVLVLAAGVYQISIRNKWKPVGIVIRVLILIGAMVSGSVWSWVKYRDRLVAVDELGGLRLGMSPVEVTVAKGEPVGGVGEPRKTKDSEEYEMTWRLENDDNLQVVRFNGKDIDDLRVAQICQFGGYVDLLGVSRGNFEAYIIEKLGEPSHESIDSDGLMKRMSYERRKVSYRIKKGKVVALCISESGKVTFVEEYGEESSDPAVGDPLMPTLPPGFILDAP